MKNLKKLSRTSLRNVKGAEEAQPCYCTTEEGSTFLGYMTYDGCYYACTKDLSFQPKPKEISTSLEP